MFETIVRSPERKFILLRALEPLRLCEEITWSECFQDNSRGCSGIARESLNEIMTRLGIREQVTFLNCCDGILKRAV